MSTSHSKSTTREGKKTRGGSIPQSVRTKYVLEDLKEQRKKLSDAYLGFVRYRLDLQRQTLMRFNGKHLTIEDANQYWTLLEEFKKLLLKLVHLDNRQLFHPFVQAQLEEANSRVFLRKLHRGLETGVKTGLEAVKGVEGEGENKIVNTYMILNVLRKDLLKLKVDSFNSQRIKPKSYEQIQRYLEHKGFIKPMTRQNFHQLATRLLSLTDRPGPLYNPKAIPQKPTKSRPEWVRTEEILKKEREDLEAIAKE